MKHKEFSKYRSSDHVEGGDEDRLFGESVYDDEDGVITEGWWKLFNEVHGSLGIGSCFNSPYGRCLCDLERMQVVQDLI